MKVALIYKHLHEDKIVCCEWKLFRAVDAQLTLFTVRLQ